MVENSEMDTKQPGTPSVVSYDVSQRLRVIPSSRLRNAVRNVDGVSKLFWHKSQKFLCFFALWAYPSAHVPMKGVGPLGGKKTPN
jgi:hypothetical protein